MTRSFAASPLVSMTVKVAALVVLTGAGGGVWLTAGLAHAQGSADSKPRDPKASHDPKDREKARTLYAEGLRRFNVAEYDAAIAAFKASYLLSGDPRLLYNVAQAYRLSGDCEQAVRFYKNFLREVPDTSDRGDVETAMHKCDGVSRPAGGPAPAVEPAATQAAPSNGSSNGPSRGAESVTPPVVTPAPAGPAAPAAAAPVPPASTSVAPAAAPAALAPELPPPAARPADEGESRRASAHSSVAATRRLTGAIIGGVGVAVLGTGIYFGLRAHARASEVEQNQGEWTAEDARLESSGKQLARTGIVLTGLGAVGLASGVALYLLGIEDHERQSSVALVPTSGGAAGVWTCAF